MLTLLLTPEKTAVAGLNTEGQIALPRVSIEELPIAVGMVKRIENPTGVQLWEPQDLTGWTIQAAIGNPFVPPTHGTFTFSHGGDTTAPVPVTGGLAAFQSAMDLLAMGIEAEEISEGYYRLTWLNNGAQALATAEPEGLIHASIAEVKMLQEGTVTTPGVQTLRLLQGPAAQATLGTYESAVVGTVTVVNTGGGFSGNHMITIALDPVPLGGTWKIESAGDSTALAYDADADTVKAAIEAIVYSLPSTTVGEGNVSVVKEGEGRYFVEFIGTRANTDMGSFSIDETLLRRAPVWTGAIDTNTEAIEDLLGTDDEVTLWLEITGAPSGGADRKLYREPITLVSPILRPTVV